MSPPTRLATAASRYDPGLEVLMQHFRTLLKRELTLAEERWLELSALLLPFDKIREQSLPSRDRAA